MSVVEEIAVPRGVRAVATQAAVELQWPTGPRAMYGLLGGSYFPSDSEFLRIAINIAAPGGRSYGNSLGWPEEQACCGLTGEFVNGVAAGLFHGVMSILTPPGRIAITHAAHGKVGSCLSIFDHLGSILAKLLLSGGKEWSSDDLRNMLDWHRYRRT